MHVWCRLTGCQMSESKHSSVAISSPRYAPTCPNISMPTMRLHASDSWGACVVFRTNAVRYPHVFSSAWVCSSSRGHRSHECAKRSVASRFVRCEFGVNPANSIDSDRPCVGLLALGLSAQVDYSLQQATPDSLVQSRI